MFPNWIMPQFLPLPKKQAITAVEKTKKGHIVTKINSDCQNSLKLAGGTAFEQT